MADDIASLLVDNDLNETESHNQLDENDVGETSGENATMSCYVCKETFTTENMPMLLSCLHTICNNCTKKQQLLEGGETSEETPDLIEKDVVECPSCKTKTHTDDILLNYLIVHQKIMSFATNGDATNGEIGEVANQMAEKLAVSNKPRTQESKKNLIIDLQKIIEDWAKENCRTKHKHVDKQEIDIDINTDKVEVVTLKTEHVCTTADKRVKSKEPQVVFTSSFDNYTDQKQSHTFKAERHTTSTFTTSVTDGYRTNRSLGLSIKLPFDTANVSTGFSDETKIQTTDSDMHSESMAWFIDTSINVPEFTRSTAIVHVEQETYNSTFTLMVKMTGVVQVTVTNKDKTILTISQDIAAILQRQKLNNSQLQSRVAIDGQCAYWVIKGESKLRYGVQQNVVLKQDPLPGRKEFLEQRETKSNPSSMTKLIFILFLIMRHCYN